jgi:Uma2 family endonuclease
MPMQQVQQHYDYILEEYLSLEEKAEYRSEYYNGEIIAMAGGTINHNRIAVNVGTALNFHFKDQKEYDVAISDVKLWIPETQHFLYPDVMVIADKPVYYENRKDTITNPLVIIEVLSKSTQHYDKGDKFRYYRTLPSFKEYILINQYECLIEQYTKISDYEWRISYKEHTDAMLKFVSFPFQISLQDIYNKVDFGS